MSLSSYGFQAVDIPVAWGESGWTVGRVIVIDPFGGAIVTTDDVVTFELPEDPGGLIPVIGDWIAVDDEGAIQEIAPRHGVILRDGDDDILAAHVDEAWILMAPGRSFHIERMEWYEQIAFHGKVTPLVVLSKADLIEDPDELMATISESSPGIDVILISTETKEGLDELAGGLEEGRTAVVLGGPGVGKSALRKALTGEDSPLTDDGTGPTAILHHLDAGGCIVNSVDLNALAPEADVLRADGVDGEARREMRDQLREKRRSSAGDFKGEPGRKRVNKPQRRQRDFDSI